MRAVHIDRRFKYRFYMFIVNHACHISLKSTGAGYVSDYTDLWRCSKIV